MVLYGKIYKIRGHSETNKVTYFLQYNLKLKFWKNIWKKKWNKI